MRLVTSGTLAIVLFGASPGCIVKKRVDDCPAGYAWYHGACVGVCIDPDGDHYGEGAGCPPDNCPNVANPSQADWDHDGIGDACDAPDAINSHVWSPDGSRIAFVRCPPGQAWDCELWVSDPDRGDAQLIYTGVAFGGLDDWQGNWILFQARHQDGSPSQYDGDGEAFRIRPDGSSLSQVTFTYTDGIRNDFSNSYYDNLGTVTWARFVAGTSLVYFLAHNGNGWFQTYLCNADGTDQWSSVSGAWGWSAAVSPTGNTLLWASGPNFNAPMTLNAGDVTGTSSHVLATGLLPPVEAAVSPDGNTVAYVAIGPAGDHLHTVGIDGSGDAEVVGGAFDDFLFSFQTDGGTFTQVDGPASPWSPDGQWLVFGSNRAGHVHLFCVRPDGSGLAQLTDGEYYDMTPSISPDGSLLAYHRLPLDFTAPWPIALVVEPFAP